MPTVAELLASFGPQDRLNAERLLAHSLGQRRSWLYTHPDHLVGMPAASRLRIDLERVNLGEPLAYLLGSWEFYSLELMVTPDTLVPRPETEQLVDAVLERVSMDQAADILDLGTGSGAIALALAQQRPLARVTAVDVSAAALCVARQNAQALNLSQVTFLEGNWWDPLANQTFDLVVSNPPYVVPGDTRLTARGEPELALFGGDDGLDAYRAISQGLDQHLRVGGHLFLEHGLDQRGALMALFSHQFSDLEGIDDYSGHPRVLVGQGFLASADD